MAKSKGKEEVTETVNWTVSCTITGPSDRAVEATIEAIEANLENGADGVEDEAAVEDFRVVMS
jgi:hypothetical protein